MDRKEMHPLEIPYGQNQYAVENHGDKSRPRHGNPLFYKLIEEMAQTHDKKSHDYASNDNPSGNYHFAGKLAQLFAHSHEDAGFIGRLGEKFYRLANLEKSQKSPSNESIEDTERDIAVIAALWMVDRRERRRKPTIQELEQTLNLYACVQCHKAMDNNNRKLVHRFRNMITHEAYLCSTECERLYNIYINPPQK